MEIVVISENGNVVLAPKGKLDTVTAPEFDTVVKENIEGTTELVMDFVELKYISSAGLRVLLTAQKTMNKQGMMKLKNVSEEIMEVLEMTGFSDIMMIER